MTVSRGGGQALSMSVETAPTRKKLPIVRLAIAAVVCGVIGLVILREIGMQRLVEWLDLFIAAIRDMGPWIFFGAMAVLPAAGAPLMAFNLVAGEAFAPQMSMLGVIVTVAVACTTSPELPFAAAVY